MVLKQAVSGSEHSTVQLSIRGFVYLLQKVLSKNCFIAAFQLISKQQIISHFLVSSTKKLQGLQVITQIVLGQHVTDIVA